MKHNLLRLFLTLTLTVSFVAANAQGLGVYSFLNRGFSARNQALGGNTSALNDPDLGLAVFNPALITDAVVGKYLMNYNRFYADINFGQLATGFSGGRAGNFTTTFIYGAYNTFNYSGESGENNLGTFALGEYAMQLGWGKAIDSLFSVGANTKFIYSNFQQFKSTGIAVDLGANYRFKASTLMVSFMVRNLGYQLKTYVSGNREPLPVNVSFAISKKLDKAPLRYHLAFDHLEQWNLKGTDPEDHLKDEANLFGTDALKEESKFNKELTNAVRHLTLGAEIVFSANTHFRLGYQFRKALDLRNPERTGTTGLSYGFGFKIKRFQFNFSRQTWHSIGGTNTFSIQANLSQFKKSKAS